MKGRRAAIAAAVGLALAASTARADAAVGDLVVTDPGYVLPWLARVLTVGPLGGEPATLAAGDPFRDPVALAATPDGGVLIADERAEAVFRMGPDGAISTIARGGLLDNPTGIALVGGTAYVSDNGYHGVLRVDIATGEVAAVATGAPLDAPHGIAVEPGGALLVADRLAGTHGSILRVDPGTGAVTTLATGDPLDDPRDVAVTPAGKVVVADDTGSPDYGRVIVLDPVTGAAQVLSAGPPFVSPRAIAVEADGDILVVDANAFGGPGGIVRVDAGSGERSELSSGRPYVNPAGLAIVRAAGGGGGGGVTGDGDGESDGLGDGVVPGDGDGGGGTGGGGAGAGAGAGGGAALDRTAPVFSLPRLSPTTFRAARRGGSIAVRTGTTITYQLNEAAGVRFTVQQRRHLSRVCRRKVARRSRHRTGTRCRHWISLKGSFSKASPAGISSLRFTGRLRGRALHPGSYRLVARATDRAGNRTSARRPTFQIVR